MGFVIGLYVLALLVGIGSGPEAGAVIALCATFLLFGIVIGKEQGKGRWSRR
jgi:hypothetical protein